MGCSCLQAGYPLALVFTAGSSATFTHTCTCSTTAEVPHERRPLQPPVVPYLVVANVRAGETIFVANVLNKPPKLTIGRIEIDKSRQTVKALDPSGVLLAFFPATVGSEEKPTPSGTLKVVSADANPNYRYNPDYKFKGVKSKEAFTIKPGPNNPVGSYWIGLSAEGYGIHGTPNPSKVSKAESHGCVRLTNWDANLLGRNIKKGTPVVFVDEPQDGRKSRANAVEVRIVPPTYRPAPSALQQISDFQNLRLTPTKSVTIRDRPVPQRGVAQRHQRGAGCGGRGRRA